MKRTKTKQPQATRAEVAAYCNATPEAIEELAEMLPRERAEYVYGKLHPATPISPEEMRKAMQSPELPRELRDVLGMLSAADEELSAYRNETAQQTLRDAIALLRSALGPHAQAPRTLPRTLPRKK